MRPLRALRPLRWLRGADPAPKPVQAVYHEATHAVELSFSKPIAGADSATGWGVRLSTGSGYVDLYPSARLSVTIADGCVQLTVSDPTLNLPGNSGLDYDGSDLSFRGPRGERVRRFSFGPIVVV